MTRIYLIRHGEAEGNVYRRAQGWYDGRITARGLRQAETAAERFRDVSLDAVYASDLSRARRTAEAVARPHALPVFPEPRLREVGIGPWEDVPWGNLRYDCPEKLRSFNEDPDRWQLPGAETFPALRARMRETVLELAARHEGQTIACVSHGTAIRTLLASLLGVPSEEIARCPHGDNTAVSLLEAEGETVRVVYYNDNSHLPEELSTFARWSKSGNKRTGSVRFAPLDMQTEAALYARLYGETWRAVHGTMEGFLPEPYLAAARRHVRQYPEAVMKALRGDELVGLTELDPGRGEREGYGWISLCYVEESVRRQMLGVQLLGHAVSVYRRMGRRSIRLHVFEGNTGAIAFYREYGFRPIGSAPGALGPLLLMEKDLG